jgi:hypothetical protein
MVDNQLSGPIPAELGNLARMSTLRLELNQLSGRVPAALGNLRALEMFWAHNNQLTGFEPPAIGGMTYIETLDFRENALDQAAIDELVAQIHAARNNYIKSNIEILINLDPGPSGNNTDPSVDPGSGDSNADWSWNGNGHDPLSGWAMVFDLRNDVRGEGFTTWDIQLVR